LSRPLVEWSRVGRAIARLALGWTALALGGVAVGAALGTQAIAQLSLAIAPFGLLASVVGVVGVSALGAMLRAGERGERLAGADVGLMPPRARGSRQRPALPRQARSGGVGPGETGSGGAGRGGVRR
jgi:hypothetical protein